MAELIDQRFEEALKIINESPQLETPINYHPSECVNSTVHQHSGVTKPKKSEKNILDVINGYHTYCNICQQHFYTTSKLNDINSFFQTHLNSIDHVWNKRISKIDKTKPIFTWEKWLCTGFCTICKQSGIKAFIINAQIDVSKILIKHLEGKMHKDKYDFILKNPFNRKMARLHLFSKIYINKISDDMYLCKICIMKIEKESMLEYHLNSEVHEREFCKFMNNHLNIHIKNVPVEINLKKMAKRLKKLDVLQMDALPTHGEIFSVKNYKIFQSIEAEMKFFTGPNFGFCPLDLEKMHSLSNEDLLQGTYCALCQERSENMEKHLSSNCHRLRIWLFNRCNAIRPISLIDYLYSSTHKLDTELENYKNIKLSLRALNLDFGITFKPEYDYINLEWDQPKGKFTQKKVNKILEKHIKKENNDFSPKITLLLPTKQTQKITYALAVVDPKDEKVLQPNCKVTDEKITGEEFNFVQHFLKLYLKKKISNEILLKSHQPINTLIPIVREYFHEHDQSFADRMATLLSYQNNPEFINTFQKWSYEGRSRYVCTLCGDTERLPRYIFEHLKSIRHLNNFELMKKGLLIPISPLFYSLNFEKCIYTCDICDQTVCQIKKPPNSIPLHLLAQAIKEHREKCCEVINVETVPEELQRKFSSAEEYNEDETENVSETHANVNTSGEIDEQLLNQKLVLEKEIDHRARIVCGESSNEKKPITPVNNIEDDSILKILQEKKKDKAMASHCVVRADEQSAMEKKNKGPVRKLIEAVESFLPTCEHLVADYLCAVCFVSEDLSLLRDHLNSKTHELNENYISTEWTLTVSVCKFCNLLILGTEDMTHQHYLSDYHVENESKISGKKVLPQPLLPKPQNMLVIKGIREIEKRNKSGFIRILLESFGEIKMYKVKRFHHEVLFADQQIASYIASLKRIWITPFKSLHLSLKVNNCELEIGMKSNLIRILSCPSELETVTSHLVLMATRMLNSEEERKKENLLCTSLINNLRCIFPHCTCFKFGSRVSGLTVGDCDLDVFLDYDYVYFTENDNPKLQEKIVKKVAEALRASGQFTRVIGIDKCRVPIVTCIHKATGILCDISFKNGLSCENTDLIKFLVSLDDRVKEVILFLKYWMKINDLHGRPFFSSYALTMLTIFYLQQEPKPILPPVEYLQYCYKYYENRRKLIGVWECGYSMNRDYIPKTENTKTTTELIFGFFRFCENFDFSNNIISPLTGKPLPRQLLRNMDKKSLPPSYQKCEAVNDPKQYSDKEPICLLDPFDLNHNLTKSFPNNSFQRFLYQCRLSATLISSFLKSENFVYLS